MRDQDRARYYHHHGRPEKHELITFSNAFHGRTMATISASNQDKMHKGFLPLLAGFKFVEFDNLEAAEAAIGPHTAGFLVEPIQGEGGIRSAGEAFIRGLRGLADEHDLMLIFDEVQCGVARTGTMFAYEQYGIEPDIMASAKGIGGGFPMGACLATEQAARGMVIGTHGSTYGGNPLAWRRARRCSMSSPTRISSPRSAKGERLRGGLEQFIGNYPSVRASAAGADARPQDEVGKPRVRRPFARPRPADGRRRRQRRAGDAAAGDRRGAHRRVHGEAVGGGARLPGAPGGLKPPLPVKGGD